MTDLVALRKYYYKNASILYNIIEIIKEREIAILDFSDFGLTKRCDNKQNTWKLSEYIDYFKIAENPTRNLFMSSAKYASFPRMYDPEQQKRRDNSYFWENVKKSIKSYDFLIDFDLDKEENRQDLINEMLGFIKILMTYKIKFFVLFSGNGYHVILQNTGIPLQFSEDLDSTRLIYYYRLGHILKEKFNLKYSCLVGCGNYNRISKLPYSLKGIKIVLPLTIEQLNPYFLVNTENFVFKPAIHDLEYFYKRGLKVFNENSGEEEFTKFIQENEIDLYSKVKSEVLEDGCN